MSKYHKYILLGFILTCLTSLILTFCPSKEYFKEEINLNESTKEYIKDKNFNNYNNYVLNFIEENKIKDEVINGRNVEINDRYFTDFDYMRYDGDTYITEKMTKDIDVSTSYFKSHKYVLLNIKGSFKDIFLGNELKIQFISEYEQFFGEILYHYFVVSSNISFNYKEKEYSLGTFNSNIENKIKYKFAIINPMVEISLFIDISNYVEKGCNAFIFEVFKEITEKENKYVFGLNSFTYKKRFYSQKYVEYLSNYLEIGG